MLYGGWFVFCMVGDTGTVGTDRQTDRQTEERLGGLLSCRWNWWAVVTFSQFLHTPYTTAVCVFVRKALLFDIFCGNNLPSVCLCLQLRCCQKLLCLMLLVIPELMTPANPLQSVSKWRRHVVIVSEDIVETKSGNSLQFKKKKEKKKPTVGGNLVFAWCVRIHQTSL